MKTSIIKPGLMVSLKTELSGGVQYDRTDLEKTADTSEWKTKKTIDNPEEFAKASQVRGKARSLITAICSNTAFGLLCPMDREGMLDEAIAKAKAMVDTFNAEAQFSKIRIFTLRGKIATTDEEAARGIASELQSLVNQMSAGIESLDPEAIRKAADEAKQMTALLSEERVGVVSEAIAQARKAARTIVARVEKKGEAAAVVAADIQRGAIEKARMLFLDLDTPTVANEAPLPAVELARFAGCEDDEAGATVEQPAMGDVEIVAAAS